MKKYGYAFLTVIMVLLMAASALASETGTSFAVSENKEPSNDVIRVGIYNYCSKASIIMSKDQTYYVGICDSKGELCSDIKEVTIPARSTQGTITFSGMLKRSGIYEVVAFLDAAGTDRVPVSFERTEDTPFYVTYASTGSAGNQVMTSPGETSVTHDVTILNHYMEMPAGGMARASFRVKLENRNRSNALSKTSNTAYFCVYDEDQQKRLNSTVYTISLSDSASSTKLLSIMFSAVDTTRKLRIVETDAEGTPLEENSEYTIAYEKQSATVSPLQDAVPILTIIHRQKKAENDGDAQEAVLEKVSGVKASAKKGRKVVLSWKKTEGAKKYQIQYSRSKSFKSGVKTKLVSGTKTTVKKLKKKKKYYFRVRAVNGSVFGPWSSVKKVKVK